ncbi:hypothetical protein Tco_0859911 [Tanacetum coccineum]|uniref:AP2/ERF domain-containing protein n=1 Tax=Tanacetum coccineum TaxID=301880 RepID=A0ABQ5BHD4_9ASTR
MTSANRRFTQLVFIVASEFAASSGIRICNFLVYPNSQSVAASELAEEATVLRDLVEHVKSKYPLDQSLESACRYAKLVQELLTNISKTCPSINNADGKLVAVTPKNKDKSVRFTKPVTSSRNTITKTTSTSNLVSNKPMLSSIGVKPSTSASGSQPSGNTKKDKIRQTPSSTQKNKVEAHPRKVKSSLKNKDCVVQPKGTAHVQHSKLNANSELKCVKCNGCMLSDNHDLCVLDFINNVNARKKSKSVNKSSKRKVWKPTGKVPLRKPTALENETPKPVVTLVYSKKPRKSKTNVPVANLRSSKLVSDEGQQYPHDLRKPLPLIPNSRGRQVIPFDHFINNDLAYLSGGVSSRTYATFVTKIKAADYGHIKWIEDLVPNTIWSEVPVNYDKHALWRISYWGRKHQQFYGFAANRESARRRLQTDSALRYRRHADSSCSRKADKSKCVESYQKKLNITKPDTYRSDLKCRDAYTAYSNPRGFIYQNKDKKNKLIRIDKLHKFSDGTLDDVRTALNDCLKWIRMEYLPKPI